MLIGNPGITTRDALVHLGGKINALTQEEVEALTIEGAVRLGVPFN